MRKFIYPFAMMAGLIIASSCTENEGARMRELRTRSISTAASASDNTGNPDAAPDANCPSPDTRMAYEDNNEAGMALSWQTDRRLQRILYHTARAGSSGTGNIRPVHL